MAHELGDPGGQGADDLDKPARPDYSGERVSVLVLPVEVAEEMDSNGFLKAFEEKQPGEGWINAGIYILRRRLLSLFPGHCPLSMEYDVFPALLASGCRLQVFRTHGDFIDIGTPEALAQAEQFIRRHAGELSE